MYFPKNFRLADAVKLAGLVQLAYGQRNGTQEGAWSLPPKLKLLGELSYPSRSGRAVVNVPTGFVARESGTVYVVFRGTQAPEEWVKNLKIRLVPYEGYGNVHLGFKETYDSFQDHVLSAVSASGTNTVVCVGHSLGASYATFAAIEIERKLKKKVAALYTFASPRIGDDAFAHAFNRRFENRSFRIVNTSDLVPSLPPPCPVFGFGGYFSHGDDPVDFTVQKNGVRENHSIATYLSHLAQLPKKRSWF